MIGFAGGRTASIAFACDRCEKAVLLAADRPIGEAACRACGAPHALRPAAGRSLDRCRRCGFDRLYTQKDFNRTLGLAIVVAGGLLSVPTWGLSLLVATLVDLLLYHVLGDVTVCYACNTLHRGFPGNPAHGPFDLHVQEQVDRMPRTV